MSEHRAGPISRHTNGLLRGTAGGEGILALYLLFIFFLSFLEDVAVVLTFLRQPGPKADWQVDP